ncbi:MAG: hypothetical protein ABI399_06200 [Bauldia sp.]
MRAVAAILLVLSLVAAPVSWAYATETPQNTVLCPHQSQHQSMVHGAMNHGVAPGHPSHSAPAKTMALGCCVASYAAAVTLPATHLPEETVRHAAAPPIDRLATAIAVEPAEPPPRA